MPPAQAPVSSRSLSADGHDIVNLKCVILSLSSIFIFVLVSFLAYQFIVLRRRATCGNAVIRISNLPALFVEGASRCTFWKRTSFFPTVSALVAQSTLVASSPLRLGIVPDKLGTLSAFPWSMDLICRGLERFLSWGRATIGLFGLVASSVQQSFSGLIRLSALPSSTLSTGDDPHPPYAAALRRLCNTSALSHLAGLQPRLLGSRSMGNIDPRLHPSGLTGPVADTDEPEPDIVLVPDTTDDTQLETDTPVIPLIVLSLPSSEHLVADLPLPIPLDEDLLGPDGTFRSTGSPAPAKVDTYDINNATRQALTVRLWERRRRLKPLSSPSILSTSGMVYRPRWL
jgi:hypothetical protein